MSPILIDTHTHLYSNEFESDIDAVIERAQQDHVQKFYLPAIDSNSLDAMLALEKKYPGVCISMMGLHPCYVKENVADELAIVEKWINDRDFVAIGEIGLDFYWDKLLKISSVLPLKHKWSGRLQKIGPLLFIPAMPCKKPSKW